MPFTFVDLFAGIGGFHAALSALDGECVFASEVDADAVAVYDRNWGDSVVRPAGTSAVAGDIVALTEPQVRVPRSDVLAAGFPCQPFSESGYQRGVEETRGTLFFNILRILNDPGSGPRVILLENVRNLAGPRHTDTWRTIVRQLRAAGYKTSSVPTIFSPHFLPPELGGTPQVRERVFICAAYVGSAERAEELSNDQPVVPRGPIGGWSPAQWDLDELVLPSLGTTLLQQDTPEINRRYGLTSAEREWVAMWDDFVKVLAAARGSHLPGFPLWAEDFTHEESLLVEWGTPKWKDDFLTKNAAFYTAHQDVIDAWLYRWFGLRQDEREFLQRKRLEAVHLADRSDELMYDRLLWTTRGERGSGVFVPASRRKLEWQAQGAATLEECVLHLRPSGIRAKQPTYLPALVAITQTSIVGSRGRRITPREAARLQGLPDWFDFGDQPDAATYKQLGNGVSVGAAYYVFREHVRQDGRLISEQAMDGVDGKDLVASVVAAPSYPVIRRHAADQTVVLPEDRVFIPEPQEHLPSGSTTYRTT